MQRIASSNQKPNLLLCFDAFGTLFTPRQPIAKQYGQVARHYGLTGFGDEDVKRTFKQAFAEESELHPNYGKSTGMGAETWWRNIITKTFQPFLRPAQDIPQGLVSSLITRFSSQEGYVMFPDVLPFFRMLRETRTAKASTSDSIASWPWEQTVVGIISNSDDRVPGILKSLGLQLDVADGRGRSNINGADVDFVLLSYDVGYEKPQRQIFDAALPMLSERIARSTARDVNSFEKLYVGDDYHKDVVGAMNAGWHALCVDRTSDAAGTAKPDGQNSSVEVIKDLWALKNWSPQG